MADDYIKQQTAINAICQDWCNRDYCGDCFFHGAKQAIDVLKALPDADAQPEPHWIPCSERLPERGEDVLVTRDYDGRKDNNKSCRYVEVASCYGEDDDITWSSFSDEYKMHPKNHYVVAWMPLPEPYRERRTG